MLTKLALSTQSRWSLEKSSSLFKNAQASFGIRKTDEKLRSPACWIPLVLRHEFQDGSLSCQLLFYKWKHFGSRSHLEWTEESTFRCKPLRCSPQLFLLPRPSCLLSGGGSRNSTSSSRPRHFTASPSLVLAWQLSHGGCVEPSALWQSQLQRAQPTASNQRKSCKNNSDDLLGTLPFTDPGTK